MFELAIRATNERTARGTAPFRYAILLTKGDKASKKQISGTIRDVKETTARIVDNLYAEQMRGEGSGVVGVEVVGEDLDGEGAEGAGAGAEAGVETEAEGGSGAEIEVGTEAEAGTEGSVIAASSLASLRALLKGIEIVPTSSYAKQGADDVWRLLQEVVQLA